jgi:hypothetical protein
MTVMTAPSDAPLQAPHPLEGASLGRTGNACTAPHNSQPRGQPATTQRTCVCSCIHQNFMGFTQRWSVTFVTVSFMGTSLSRSSQNSSA